MSLALKQSVRTRDSLYGRWRNRSNHAHPKAADHDIRDRASRFLAVDKPTEMMDLREETDMRLFWSQVRRHRVTQKQVSFVTALLIATVMAYDSPGKAEALNAHSASAGTHTAGPLILNFVGR